MPTKDFLYTAIVVIVSHLSYVAFKYLYRVGGTPTEEATSYRYRLRPMTSLTLTALAIMAIALLVAAFQDARAGDTESSHLRFAVGLVLLVVSAICRSDIVVDFTGIQKRRSFVRTTLIRWKDLRGIEKQRNRRSRSTTYYIRAANGVTIAANDRFFNTEDLIPRVRATKAIHNRSHQV